MFRVEWEPTASNQFAAMCLAHQGRWNDINAADNFISAELERDPFRQSTALSEGLWRIIAIPLAVYFSIEGNTVTVQAIGWTE